MTPFSIPPQHGILPTKERRIARVLADRYVDNGLSYLQLGEEKTLFLASTKDACLGFQTAGGYAIVPGQPVGPVSAWSGLIQEFEEHCLHRGLAVAFCGITADALPRFRERGYRFIKAGDDAVIDLPPLTLRGKQWQECRAALNRARKRGYSFSWVQTSQRTGALALELEEVSRQWLSSKRLPELRFALGTHESIFDHRTLLAIARGPDGRLEGFVTWAPVPTEPGWMMDMMRRRADTMAGLMDFLVTRSLLDFQSLGFRTASLGGTPLSNIGHEQGGVLRSILDLAFQRLQRAPYAPKSLLHYKRKFNPRWSPLYLVYQAKTPLPQVFYALLRACAPTLGLGQIAQIVLGSALVWPGAGSPRTSPRRASFSASQSYQICSSNCPSDV